MSKEAVFTMKLEPELRDDFMAAAAAEHRPASQVARDLMRNYVRHQRETQEYSAFLAEKVQFARAELHNGEGVDHAQVEAEFSARRSQVG